MMRGSPACVVMRPNVSDHGGAQVAGQHHLASVGPPERAGRAEGFVVPGVDALPAEDLVQMLGNGRLSV